MRYPTQEFLRKLFDYDPITGKLTRKIQRANSHAGTVVGTKVRAGYLVVSVDNTQHKVHRIIWIWLHGEIPAKRFIDHINGITSDNRQVNLRLVDYVESARNKAINRRNKLGYTGINLVGNRYCVSIMATGKRLNIGHYLTREEALAARQAAEKCLGYITRP